MRLKVAKFHPESFKVYIAPHYYEISKYSIERKTNMKESNEMIRQAVKDGSLFTRTALLKRGWTKEEIAEHLPEPELYKNPVVPSGAPMQIWEADGVIAIEQENRLGKYKVQQESV